jgi:hypothetical protein
MIMKDPVGLRFPLSKGSEATNKGWWVPELRL